MKMHPCNTCPFMNLASEEDMVDDPRLFGWCQKDHKIVFVAKVITKHGCGEHPETMQQYEELRATAQAKGAAQVGTNLYVKLIDPG